MRITGSGKDTQVEVLWTSAQGAPETSSPVLYDGKLFMVSTRGVLTCHDAESGERLWRRRLAQNNYHVSLVAGDDKVYVPNAKGLTTVVKLKPKLRFLPENILDEGGNASPAIAGGSILIRTKSQLLRIDKESEPAPKSQSSPR